MSFEGLSIETAIVDRLRKYPALNQYVGGRIYSGELDAGLDAPNIAYELQEDEPVMHMQGAAGLAKAIILLNIWAETVEEAKPIREQARLAFNGFNGQMGNYYIRGLQLKDGGDIRYRNPENKKLNRQGVQLELTLWHKETIPSFQE